ncbi:MAG: hypothetical protein WBM17_03850 [Anaerolineales bacterium]
MAAADQHRENTRSAFLEKHTRRHKMSGSKNGVSLKGGFFKTASRAEFPRRPGFPVLIGPSDKNHSGDFPYVIVEIIGEALPPPYPKKQQEITIYFNKLY